MRSYQSGHMSGGQEANAREAILIDRLSNGNRSYVMVFIKPIISKIGRSATMKSDR